MSPSLSSFVHSHRHLHEEVLRGQQRWSHGALGFEGHSAVDDGHGVAVLRGHGGVAGAELQSANGPVGGWEGAGTP